MVAVGWSPGSWTVKWQLGFEDYGFGGGVYVVPVHVLGHVVGGDVERGWGRLNGGEDQRTAGVRPWSR